MREDQLYERSVVDAIADGVMCPALLELVCGALASSGTAPERVCPTLTAIQGLCSSACWRMSKVPGPNRLEATMHMRSHACSGMQSSMSWSTDVTHRDLPLPE